MHQFRLVSVAPRALCLAFAVMTWGCHAMSVCDPPGRASGQIIKTKISRAYAEHVDQDGDPPHVACRAEASIPIAILYVKTSDPKTQHDDLSAQDVAADAPVTERSISHGEYRVLGIGRGLDAEDCGKPALEACNDAVDRYYVSQRAVRPIGVVCTLADDRDRCPARVVAGLHAR